MNVFINRFLHELDEKTPLFRVRRYRSGRLSNDGLGLGILFTVCSIPYAQFEIIFFYFFTYFFENSMASDILVSYITDHETQILNNNESKMLLSLVSILPRG